MLGSMPPFASPIEVTVFFDYHCPYSDRAVAWLESLGPAIARPTYRMFGLEQVNRDPGAVEWRLWDQPLDYEHHRGRPDRRSLAAFLATAFLEATASPDVVRAFRSAVYRARFDDEADISDLELLLRLARGSGGDDAALAAAFADPDRLDAARTRMREDCAEARRGYAVFGVPTLRLPGDRPFYLRLARAPEGSERLELLERLVDLRLAAPWLLELKLPEPAPDG